MKISIVVPIYNEEENVAELYREVKNVCQENNYTFEIIFVDDGSTDNTAEVISSLSPVKYIRFRKNFGQTAAMDAGIKHSRHPYVVTMDGDGQNYPGDIPKMIQYLENESLDMVCGWRKDRKDGFMKNFISRGANFLRGILINDGVHDSGCSLKLFKKSCFDDIHLYGEMHRLMPGLLKIKGYKVGETVVHHRPRMHGVTKYNWKRTVKGFIDMISVWFWNKFAARPLHLLGGAGLFFMLLSIPSALVTFSLFLQGMGMSETAWPMLTAFLFLSGLQMFISGLLADILMKNYHESTKALPYSIEEIVEK